MAAAHRCAHQSRARWPAPAIIILSLVLGFWLVGSSIYLIVS